MTKKERKLYKIGHLTNLLGITPRTVRYYDQFGLLPHVKRSGGKVRLFDEEDIEIIKRIRRMQKEEYLPLEVIKERLFGKKKKVATDAIVVTDSTACLLDATIQEMPIEVISLEIEINDKKYKDGVDIKPKELWELSQKIKKAPVINPVSIDKFIKKYQELAKKGYKEIYSIHLSSMFSETYKNAKEAAKQLADQISIQVIDSKSIGAGLGLVVQIIAEGILKKNSKEEMQVLISKNIPLVQDIVTVSSIEFLFTKNVKELKEKGDAAKPAKLLVEEVKNVKPVLTLNPLTGQLELVKCCNEKQCAVDNMVELFEKEIEARGTYVNQISVIYGNLYGEALELINRLKTIQPQTPITLHEESSVVSTYIGPESLGISFV